MSPEGKITGQKWYKPKHAPSSRDKKDEAPKAELHTAHVKAKVKDTEPLGYNLVTIK